MLHITILQVVSNVEVVFNIEFIFIYDVVLVFEVFFIFEVIIVMRSSSFLWLSLFLAKEEEGGAQVKGGL